MPTILPSLIHSVIFFLGLLVLVMTSNFLLRKFEIGQSDDRVPEYSYPKFLSIISKCENVLFYIFIWNGEFTAFTIFLAAKLISFSQEMQKESSRILSSTLTNAVYSMFMAIAFKDISKYISLINIYNNPTN